MGIRHPLAVLADRKPLPPAPVDAGWERFCIEIEARIEDIRMEQADACCPTCGSTTPERPQYKRCPACQRTLNSQWFGYRYGRQSRWLKSYCRPCNSQRLKDGRTRKIREALRRSA